MVGGSITLRAIVVATVLLALSACAPTEPSASNDSTTTQSPGSIRRTTKPSNRSRNIVRIVTDDQDLSSLRVMEKTLKLLGATGVMYGDSVVTLSLCCPSRVTLLTGQYTHNHKVWNNGGNTGGYGRFDDQDNSLAPWLQKAGYRTALVGKYLNGYTKDKVNEVPEGWDHWFATVDGEDSDPQPYYGYTVSEDGTARTFGTEDADYATDVFTDRAVGDLKKMAASGEPFFLDFWPIAPHSGRGRGPRPGLGPTPAPKYENANPGVQAPRTPNFLPSGNDPVPDPLKVFAGVNRQANGGPEGYPALIDASYRDYLNSLLSVDDAIERLVNEVRAAGQLENTVFIFTSDNGLMWGNHGLVNMKWEPYEESLRVPLIISGPGFPKGEQSDQPVANIDVVPTILAIAGASAGRVMDGRSLLPGTPKTPNQDRVVLIESNMYNASEPYQFPGYKVPRFKGVRGGGYQYTEWDDGSVELYDILNDRAQMNNLIASSKHEANKQKLREALEKLDTCAGAECSVDVVGLTHP